MKRPTWQASHGALLTHYSPGLELSGQQTRWVVLRWPTPSMAQSAGMSTEAFEDFISTSAR
jgi:leucyl aminopeptidase (aminopeptidase T)